MDKFLVDTTVLIDHLRGNKLATEVLTSENITISFVTIVELIQGARNKTELKVIQDLLCELETDWGTEETNKKAVEILSDYHLKNGLGFIDALLAATALNNHLVLVTDNIKHFLFIPKLKVLTLTQCVEDLRNSHN